jgi:hypothetical protein
VSVWRAALGAREVRKVMENTLQGTEDNLSLYLNPTSPKEFGGRVLADSAHEKHGSKLSWAALGHVDLLSEQRLEPSQLCPAALPVNDRLVKRKTVTIPSKTAARLALQPLSLDAGDCS